MTTRLDTVSPDLVRLLRVATPETRKTASVAACEFAISQSGVRDPVVLRAISVLSNGDPISSTDRDAVRELASRLDDEYLDAYEAEEASKSTHMLYLQPFHQARAIAAVAFATDAEGFDSATESIYEAMAAVDESQEVAELVRSILERKGRS